MGPRMKGVPVAMVYDPRTMIRPDARGVNSENTPGKSFAVTRFKKSLSAWKLSR